MRAIGIICGGFMLLWATVAAQAQIDALTGGNGKAIVSDTDAPSIAAENENLITESKPIPYKVRYEVSRTVGRGRIVLKQPGRKGELITFYKVSNVNGKSIRQKVRTQRVEPQDEIHLIGQMGYATSRGHYDRGRVLVMEATAYDPSAGRGKYATGRTKMGIRARYGVVAVDPRVIPLGTMVYVEGYGLAYACDVGSAIKGNKIDICLNTYAECIRFGRRKVRVHILK